MGPLIDELQRREAAARGEAEDLRGRIEQLTERLAQVEERLSRLVIARETVDELLGETGAAAAVAAGKGRSGGASPPRRRGRPGEQGHARGVAGTRPPPRLVRPAPGNPAPLPRPRHGARRGEQ
jgi:hypothetical protein